MPLQEFAFYCENSTTKNIRPMTVYYSGHIDKAKDIAKHLFLLNDFDHVSVFSGLDPKTTLPLKIYEVK